MTPFYAPLIQQMLQAFQEQKLESAEHLSRSILKINSNDLVALQIAGLIKAFQGKALEAVPIFEKVIELDPKNPEALNNLSKAQFTAELYNGAIQSFLKLNKFYPNNPQILTDLGTSYAKLRQYEKAKVYLDQAIKLQPDYFIALTNMGNLLSDQGYFSEAVVCYEKAIAINSLYPEAWTNLGNALHELGMLKEAEEAHESALKINPNYAEAWSNIGNVLLDRKKADLANKSFQKAYSLKPSHPYLIGQLYATQLTSCIWENSKISEQEVLSNIVAGRMACMPFISLQTSAALDIQQRSARTFIADRFPEISGQTLPLRDIKPGEKIRVGYFSSDFKEHPVGILFENLIRFHDFERFDIRGYFLNSPTGDKVEESIKRSLNQTYDLFLMTNDHAKKMILDHQLDIAIDLNGHTQGARTGLFSHGIAPVQVNYLGYAGTLGANYYQYIIADRVVIPENHKQFYDEQVAYLPNSFFPIDTSVNYKSISLLQDRSSQGLPHDCFVFACFNNAYKITPEIFSIWMNLLRRNPNSVLWLSKPSDIAIDNLKKEALKRDIDPRRLIFASRVADRAEHLGRLALADLFLDTPHYNAHATAADALWSGLPVLTMIGNTFASRVAASQLSALNLSEMITHSMVEYEAKAMELASNPTILLDIRNRISNSRETAPLFNSRQYVNDLENLYISFLKK